MSLFGRFAPEGHDQTSFYLKLLFWTSIILSAIVSGDGNYSGTDVEDVSSSKFNL